MRSFAATLALIGLAVEQTEIAMEGDVSASLTGLITNPLAGKAAIMRSIGSIGALVLALLVVTAGCQKTADPRPQVEPVEQPNGTTAPPSSPTAEGAVLGQAFTIAWTETDYNTNAEVERNLTITLAKTIKCGNATEPLVQQAAAASKASYGELAEPAPTVPSGYELCVILLSVANTGKTKLQHETKIQAIATDDVTYDLDDAWNQYIGHGVTSKNPLRFGGTTVELNPRATANSSVAFLLPLATKVEHMRYIGTEFSAPPTAIAMIDVADGQTERQ